MRTLALYSKIRRKRLYPEASLQITVVEYLRLIGTNGLIFFHPVNEGKRSAIAGLFLRRMGLLAGLSDLVIIVPNRPILFLELKAKGEKQTPEQIAFEAQATAAGHTYALADNIADALRILEEHGAIRRSQPRRDAERQRAA